MFEDVLRAFGGEGTKHKRGSDSRKSENIDDLDDQRHVDKRSQGDAVITQTC